MKLAFNLSLFLSALLTFADKSFSLTDHQIKMNCRKEKRELTCIKNLKEKRSTLENGNIIEIPILPYKR